ncbi:MAG: FecR domain-containing protein [Halioglobus sp.]
MSDRVIDEAVTWHIKLRSPEVSSGERHAHQEWLAAKESHQRAYETVGSEWADLDDLDGWARGELAQRNLTANLLLRRRKKVWFAGFATAASFALAIIILPRMQEAPDRYQTDKAERREISLTDGSRLHLNATSAVDVSFNTEVRKLTLEQGEGVFDVEHDSKRPFVVVAGNSKVIALGTRFSVLRMGSQDIEVTVLDGRVAVVPLNQSVESAVKQFSSEPPSREIMSQIGQRKSLVLEADQQARVGANGQFLSLLEVSAASEAAWIEGKLVFDNTPLREVVEELARYIPGSIRVDPSVPDHPVTGIIHIRSSETMLDLLSQVVPVTPVKQSASLTILHPAPARPNNG